jgi:hypothetical protein
MAWEVNPDDSHLRTKLVLVNQQIHLLIFRKITHRYRVVENAAALQPCTLRSDSQRRNSIGPLALLGVHATSGHSAVRRVLSFGI